MVFGVDHRGCGRDFRHILIKLVENVLGFFPSLWEGVRGGCEAWRRQALSPATPKGRGRKTILSVMFFVPGFAD